MPRPPNVQQSSAARPSVPLDAPPRAPVASVGSAACATNAGSTGLESAAADRRIARVVALCTVAVALLAAGGIEWAGWQVIYRLGGAETVPAPDVLGVPLAPWALGVVRNAAAALGVGVGSAALVSLIPGTRTRRRRAASRAFALGTVTVLIALAALTSWAP